jgi:TonB family protein
VRRERIDREAPDRLAVPDVPDRITAGNADRLSAHGAFNSEAPDTSRHRWSFVLPIAGVVAFLFIGWAAMRAFIHSKPTPPSANVSLPSSAQRSSVTAPVEQQPETPPPAQEATEPAQAASSASNTKAVNSKPVAAVVHQEIPKVPRSARQTIHGHVRVAVRVTVNSSGAVVSEVLAEPGPSRYFAQLAVKAAGKWKFSHGQDQASREWLVRFVFSRDGTTGQAVTLRS